MDAEVSSWGSLWLEEIHLLDRKMAFWARWAWVYVPRCVPRVSRGNGGPREVGEIGVRRTGIAAS